MGKFNNRFIFLLVLIINVFVLPISIVGYTEISGQIKKNNSVSSKKISFQTKGFSKNILLSRDDSNWNHHVEPMIAISDNGTLFVGWKNANTHNGPGERVSIVKSIDSGVSWTIPFDMPMYNGLNTKQSDPWLIWHNQSIYYAYIE